MRPLESQSKTSLDDLLQLKRAERPAPEFWNQFERELRVKQLAAIMEKRPWWDRFPQGWAARTRGLSAAAAILVLALFGVRTYQDGVFAPKPVVAVELAGPGPSGNAPMASTTMAAAQEAARPESVGARSMSNASAFEVVALRSGTVTDSKDRKILLAPKHTLTATSPSPRAITANLSVLETEEATLDERSSLFRDDTERVAMGEGTLNEPLVQVVSTGDPRKARLLAVAAPLSDMDRVRAEVSQTREQIASRLDDDTLYSGVRRLGLGGDRVSIRF